jgi:hypothetical protein
MQLHRRVITTLGNTINLKEIIWTRKGSLNDECVDPGSVYVLNSI